jgi:putative hemin transport protein
MEAGMNFEAATNPEQASLRSRIVSLRSSQPALRARDAAASLGVSEAELVAAGCGETATRLQGPWGALVAGLQAVGPVMALTRNEYAVHEKHGTYNNVSMSGNSGLVLNPDIDLRIFYDRWHHGFAVAEETRSGPRRSLQIFDSDGTAVHKVYAVAASDIAALDALIERHRSGDKSSDLAVTPRAAAKPNAAGGADAASLRRRWDALQDTHDFFPMLRDLKLDRLDAFRLVEGVYTEAATADSFRRALEMAAAESVPIMVFVGSPGVIQIHGGPVANLREDGPWFNVLDPGFNLHLRMDGIAASWIVRKPSRDGIVTSLEIFDSEGRQIAWLFGQRKPGEPELSAWRRIVERLPRMIAQ